MFVGLNVKCQLLPDFYHNLNVLTGFSKIIYFMKISSVILTVLQARCRDRYGQPATCICATYHCDTAKMTLTLMHIFTSKGFEYNFKFIKFGAV
jgi:hypothetical protein